MGSFWRRFLTVKIFLVCLSTTSFAVPEAARFGYFQCVSCHVSPGGSGLLTAYGRSFSAERLVTWKKKNEENPLHGLLPSSETYLVGADARVVHLRTKEGEEPYIKTWGMQLDGDLGVHYGPAWLSATIGKEPEGPEERPNAKEGLLLRAYQARLDLFDDRILVRAGQFVPRHGLGLVDHTAYVRSFAGLPPDAEQRQAEVIWQSENYEIGAAMLFKNEDSERAADARSGYATQASVFFLSKHRVNFNVLRFDQSDAFIKNNFKDVIAVSAVLSMNQRACIMAEWDQIADSLTISGTKYASKKAASYASLHYEAYRGVEPYAKHEYADSDTTKGDTSTNRYSLGLVWRPRPHFSLDTRATRAFSQSSKTTRDALESIFHYYL